MAIEDTLINPLLLIDWSVVAHKNWHKMGSDGYEPETGHEHLEFASNTYQYMLYLTTRFKSAELILCMDSKPYWRDKVYRNYYVKNSQIYIKKDEEDLRYVLVKYDMKTLQYTYSDEKVGWFQKKVSVADQKLIDYSVLEEITEEAEKYAVLYGTLKEYAPKYKGKRSSSPWKYNTPKVGYTDEHGSYVPGFYDLSAGLAKSIAGTFGGKILSAPEAEADDIIAHMVKTDKSARSIIVVSVDTDLHQLLMDNMFMLWFNPNEYQPKDGVRSYAQWGSFWGITPESARFDLRKKILCGDTGDNIPSCLIIDKKTGALKSTGIGEITADKMLSEMSMKEIKEIVDPVTFDRNRRLIHLDNIPMYIRDRIQKSFESMTDEEYVPEKEYNLSNRKRLDALQSAYFDSGMIKESEETKKELETATTDLPHMENEDD